MDIINSEGTIIGIEKIKNSYYLKIKNKMIISMHTFKSMQQNQKKYFSREINTRELLILIEEFAFINELYAEIENDLKTNYTKEILTK